MNAEELIPSGLLEAYVLGEGTGEERAFVERMAREHAEVKAELEAIERALEAHAFATAVQPPDRVRAAVLQRIAPTPAAGEGRVIPLAPERPVQRSNFWAAAAVVALLASAVANFFLYGELRQVRGRLASIEQEREVLAQELQVQKASYQRSSDDLAVLMDPALQLVTLNGMGEAKEAKARIYWDPKTRTVHMGPATLPPAPKGKQYQLWAIVDGQPVDAGMMPLVDDGAKVHRMKDIGPAQAFAVTLEQEGGVASPTLEAMVLMGTTGTSS
ncbi:MAG TPA: anti-sigma factor [Flavobacteriales bacterium]